MKILTSLMLACIVFCCFSNSYAQNRSLPDITVKTLNGESINVQDLGKSGKITVLSFWATWCVPCKKELDAIADIYPDWQEKYGVELVAITIDDARSLAKVKPMVAEKGWEYTILSDINKDMMTSLNFQNVPFTFLLDSSGSIVYQHSGYIPGDEFELEKEIAKLATK